MIRRITLIDFMAHEHTVLELTEGVNVLIGPNNCGKSAVVEAIRAVCENTRGNYMIRHGAKESQVLIETDDGDKIEWRRRARTASYVINGEETHRGRVPDQLHQRLKMPLIEVKDGTEAFDVHLGEQKTPIFLIDQPASKIATFFASASDAHYLLLMQDVHRQNVREQKSRLTLLADRIQKNESTIKTFAPLPDIERQLKELRGTREVIATEAATMDRLRGQLKKLSQRQIQLKSLKAAKTEHDQLQPPPKLNTTHELIEKTATHRRLLNDVHAHRGRLTVLSHLTSPPTIDNQSELKQQIASLTKHLKNATRIRNKHEKVESKLCGIRDELHDYFREHPNCPHCQQPWTEEHWLQMVEKGEHHEV